MKKQLQLFIWIIFLPVLVSGQQIENSGFEFWEDVGTVVDEPVDWSSIKTCDQQSIANAAPVTFERSDDAHSGNYSLKLYNVSAFGLIATGAICNGRFHAEFDLDASYSYTDTNDARWNMQIGARPDSLAGWFKFFPSQIDKAQFKVVLHVDECKLPENGTLDNWIGMAVYQTEPGTTYENWTRFSVPFEYFTEDKPEYLLCVINSGDSTAAYEGSYLLVDDLELIYTTSAGFGDHVLMADYMMISGRNVVFTLEDEIAFDGSRFNIIDLSGRNLLSKEISGPEVISLPRTMNAGVYIAVLDAGDKRFVQKFYLGQ